jgi:adenosylcobinamide-GDP ribazoletransferase
VSFLTAIQFLTSIPIPIKRELTPAQLGGATVWFPVVGLIIGLVLAGLNWLLLLILPAAVVNGLLVVALVILTGAMHLDGLADTCDGIAGHKTTEERRKVMRDSRTGAFGVVGIVLVLLVKYISLNNIPPVFMTAVLIFMPVVSRWAMVYAIYAYRYARPSGLGTAYKQATRWPQFTAATIFTIILALALFPLFSLAGLIFIFGTLLVTTALACYLKHKFAGLTGDTYGAINEVAEVITLLIAIAIFNCVAPISQGYCL